MVRKNLLAFLACARMNFLHQEIWIDALCINQQDMQERSHQVGQMDHIYQNADQVIIWLGYRSTLPGSSNSCDSFLEGSRSIIAKARKLENLKDEHYEVKCRTERMARSFAPKRRLPIPEYIRAWRYLSRLTGIYNHKYWTRTWIIQEVVLSTRKIIVFDNCMLDWFCMPATLCRNPRVKPLCKEASSTSFQINLSKALSVLIHSANLFTIGYSMPFSLAWLAYYLDVMNCMDSYAYHPAKVFEEAPFLEGAARHITATLNFIHDYTQGSYVPIRSMLRFGRTLCSDPRDKIFGLLAFMSPECRIQADYTLTIHELFLVFIENVVRIKPPVVVREFICETDLDELASLLMGYLGIEASELISNDRHGRVMLLHSGSEACEGEIVKCQHCNANVDLSDRAPHGNMLLCFHEKLDYSIFCRNHVLVNTACNRLLTSTTNGTTSLARLRKAVAKVIHTDLIPVPPVHYHDG